MNDILNGLNSSDDGCSDTSTTTSSCGSFGFNPGFNNGPGFGGPGFGGGFSSWIWILLILFYGGCGTNSFLGGGGYGCGRNTCCEPKRDDCCYNNNRGNCGGGIFGNCSSYLFLLVILFICNGFGGNNFVGPFGGQGFGGGFSGGFNPCDNLGCGTTC